MALRQDVLKKYASKASLRRERSLSQKAEHLEKKIIHLSQVLDDVPNGLHLRSGFKGLA